MKRARNSKGRFVKGHGGGGKHRKKSSTKTIVVRTSSAPAVRRSHSPARRKSRGLFGSFGGGFIGRMMPDQQDLENAGAGYALGWLVRGYKAGPGTPGQESLAYKITDALPKWWDGGGLIGNIAIAATFLSAVTRHPWARALKRAAITCTFYDYAKRDGAAAAADAVEGYPDDPQPQNDNDQSTETSGWVNPDAFDRAA